jgi:hypothetical protein
VASLWQLLLFMLVPAALAVGAHAVFRSLVPPKTLIAHHDVAGFLVAIVGVLYAVVLGFLVVTSWSAFDAAQRTANLEAGDVAELFGLANTLPEPTRTQVRKLCAEYAFEVRDVEWPMLADVHQDPAARGLLNAITATLASMPAGTTPTEAEHLSALREMSFTNLRDVSIHRRARLLDSADRLPAAMHVALVLGALLVMAFVFLFGVESAPLQFVMTGLVAGSIGLLLGVIAEFDPPYHGGLRVSPAAWTLVIENNHLTESRLPGKP